AGEMNATTLELDKEEHVQASQPERLDGEEVTLDDAGGLLAQELGPTQACSSRCRLDPVAEDVPDGCWVPAGSRARPVRHGSTCSPSSDSPPRGAGRAAARAPPLAAGPAAAPHRSSGGGQARDANARASPAARETTASTLA